MCFTRLHKGFDFWGKSDEVSCLCDCYIHHKNTHKVLSVNLSLVRGKVRYY